MLFAYFVYEPPSTPSPANHSLQVIIYLILITNLTCSCHLSVFLYLEDRVSFMHPVFPSSGLLLLSSLSRRRMTLLTRLLILLSSLRLSRTTLLPALKEPPIFIQRIDDFSKTYGRKHFDLINATNYSRGLMTLVKPTDVISLI